MPLKRINRNRIIITALTIGSFIFAISQGRIGYQIMQPTSYEESVQRWIGSLFPHTPIRITSNANFTSLNGVSGGLGTPASPWIIENWVIFGGGIGSCILIANTTDYFIIRHCALWNASTDMFQAGIVLQNVTNAHLENNNCYSNGWCGIYLAQTNESFLLNNWCWDTFLEPTTNIPNFNLQHGSGIFLNESHYNILSNNNCTNNDKGISLVGCDNNTLQYNTIQNNMAFGIYFDQSSGNFIISNVGKGCSGIIDLERSNGNRIEKNQIQNAFTGIYIFSSHGNVITQNSFYWLQNYIVIPGCEIDSNCNPIEENLYSPITPLIFGAWYNMYFWPGILGWTLYGMTGIFLIGPSIKRIILRYKKETELRALHMKEEYYKQLQQEHTAVLTKLKQDSQTNNKRAEGAE